jgi:hypothetical protein
MSRLSVGSRGAVRWTIGDNGITEDVGERPVFELPLWDGAHSVELDADEPAYPLPVHPLELGDGALRELSGYALEVSPEGSVASPEEIPLAGFRRRPGWRRALARIDLYPFIGWCQYGAPAYSPDDCAIAWGGVLAQMPFLIVGWVAAGFRDLVSELSALVLVFGYMNIALIVLNLLPIDPLDGHRAWRLVPHVLRSARRR